MIKVYLFITGLALYQFSSTGGPTTVIFPSGDYDYPSLAHIPRHTLSVLAGDYDSVTLPLPLESTLAVACPSGGCSAIQVPVNIPQIAELLDGQKPAVNSKCATLGTAADCHPRNLRTAQGRNGVLQLSGNWSAEALTDCEGGYPQALGPFVDLNYLRATRPWEPPMFNDSALFKPTVNSVLFLISVGSMDELKVSNTALKAALERPTSTTICNTLPHFQGSGASGCAVVLIRSGQNHEAYVSGQADLHFAALYSLLDNNLDPKTLWLPTALKWRVCPGGGSGNGMSHCTGGIVVAP